jgi:cobalamin biosynthesis protein CobT
LEKVLKNNTDDTPLSVAILALIRWDCEVSGPLFPSCALVGETYPRNEKFEKILEVFTPRLIACQEEPRKIEGTKLSYELARDIFRALGGDPDKEEREKFLELESSIEEKEGEDKPKKSKETDKKAKEGKLKKEEDEEWCIKKVELKDLPSKLVTTHDLDHGHMSKVGLEHDTIFDSGSWEITPVDDFVVVDYYNHSSTHTAQSSQLNTDSTAADFYCNAFETRVKNEVSVSENFAQQVKRLIQIRARVRYEYGVKKGKLDQARLSRIVLKTPGFSERVFKNKINSTVLNAAVTVLIDMSGSMAGDKVLYAGQAAVLLNNVFQVLQVPLEILGFTDTYVGRCPPVMYVYKPFIQPKLSESELVKNIGASSASMLGNPDGESILWAYDRLLKRREKKRLLIVMSDGQPAASRGNSGLSELTLKIIEEIEQQKKVEIYGLGLCSDAVNDFYKDNSVVNNAADIPQKLLELIERKLFNER